jgi:hypothetical protein
MAYAGKRSGAPFLLVGGFALFLAVIVYLVASSLSKRDIPTYSVTPIDASRPAGIWPIHDTVTVDAFDAKSWRFFDFARGSVTIPPDTNGWDLAFRRYNIIAANAIADVGPTVFSDVVHAPDGGFIVNDVGRDTVNRAIGRWYTYNFLTHLLEPNGHVYAVRTGDGQYAKLEILSYYCTGLKPGCVTFRYGYPIGTAPAPPARH